MNNTKFLGSSNELICSAQKQSLNQKLRLKKKLFFVIAKITVLSKIHDVMNITCKLPPFAVNKDIL